MSPKKLIIVGAGYTGQHLIDLTGDTDLSVVATSRNQATLERLRDQGVTAINWNIDDPLEPLVAHMGPDTALIYSVPTLFRDYDAREEPPRHVAPLQRLVQAAEQAGLARFIYLSSTSVYGDHGGEWVDEGTELRPNAPYGKMRADIENYLLEAPVSFPVTIARLGGIYGPQRTLVRFIQSGRYTLVDGGKKVTNRIHVHDIARALLAIIDHGPDTNRVFNFTDGHPQPTRDVLKFVCEQTGLDWPKEESFADYAARVDDLNRRARRTNAIRVLNERLRRELDFELVYPDVFAGYQAILATEDDGPTADKNSVS